MNKESYPYILFAGKAKDDLYPVASFIDEESGKLSAEVLLKKDPKLCLELAFMPEDDDDTNEVVWSNCGRR